MNIKVVNWVVLELSAISYLFPLLYLLPFKNRQPDYLNWLAVSLGLSLFAEIIAQVLLFNGINPNYAVNTYWVVSTFFITTFFYKLIGWKSLRAVYVIVNITYLIFASANAISVQMIGSNTYTMTFQSLLIICWCIAFYYKLLKELPSYQLQKNATFWIVSAFFFSYSGKLVIHAVSNYLIKVLNDNMYIVWTTHNLLSLIGIMVLTYGTYLHYQEYCHKKLSASEQTINNV